MKAPRRDTWKREESKQDVLNKRDIAGKELLPYSRGAFIDPVHPVDPVLLFIHLLSDEKGQQASLASAEWQMNGCLKSLPSEMSPEGSLPKAGFHRAGQSALSVIIHGRKAGSREAESTNSCSPD